MMLACAAAAISTACVHVDPQQGVATVGELVAARSPYPVTWLRSEEDRAAIANEVDRRLEAPLDPIAAIEVSLLGNPRVQALYEEIGISAADVVAAATVSNPVLSAEVFWPGGGATTLETGIAQNLLSLVMRPARRRLAETQYRRAQLQVAAEVLEHAAEVEAAYWELVAAEHAVELRGTIAAAAEAASELAARMRTAGTASELDAARERALHETTLVALRRAEGDRVSARERLARLLGLEAVDAEAFTTPARLPDLPAEDPPLEGLELLAVDERLDLEAAGQEVEALAQALGITRKWRWFVLAELGVEADRELDGEWLVGPSVALQLPIFDRRRGELRRREAELRQAEHRLRGLALEIRSQVREEREDMLLARDLVRRYREVVIPLRARVVALLQQRHNFMLVGAFELLEARREEFESYEEYLHAVRDYYVARARLARAVGGRLPRPAPSEAPAAAAPSPAHEHPGTGGAS
jgi:outer membrane protein, heavy metal efflux system